ncbi:bile acid:sodium symporter family protein [Sphingobacterium rhinopitheci]|uniref:bile acid:sodium symporter family protein n=1 Tax=Sphingobacterium rhinopitheci TaxID=2781960 RepID=UPI001F51780F|nr:bile acid:sodium symporter family protein [Sphingobacterium rhinopitheci]MCI0919757.1 bile acid:sodium symporter [Sphingobacterium rhinopitheci]
MKFDSFILFLLLSIVLAYLFPQLAVYHNGDILGYITTIGVSLIFFFYGLKLSIHDIKTGLSNWKLHVLVQATTFLLFPIVILLFYPLIETVSQHNFWISFFFLAALPSTVSSSVVMVSIAKGNIPAAIFNASISGLIGVIITPLWMSLFLDFQTENVFVDVYWGLIKEIIIPVALGLFLQRYLGHWASKYSKKLSQFDKTVILFIVYGSFAESFVSGVFDKISNLYLLYVFIAVSLLFVLVYTIVFFLSKHVFKFSQTDQITALFCGSKKSLTHGSVFGKFLFVNNPNAGLYFLPLMIFHALQIFIVTIIAQSYHNKRK